jgi:WXG100 family type VII secretion target
MTYFGVNANGFSLNPNAMVRAIDDIKRSLSALVSQQADLQSMLRPLAASWHGTGSENWASVQRNWDTAAQGVYDFLQDLLSALSTSYENYTISDANVAGIWQ